MRRQQKVKVNLIHWVGGNYGLPSLEYILYNLALPFLNLSWSSLFHRYHSYLYKGNSKFIEGMESVPGIWHNIRDLADYNSLH